MNDKEIEREKYDYGHNTETLYMQKPNIQRVLPKKISKGPKKTESFLVCIQDS